MVISMSMEKIRIQSLLSLCVIIVSSCILIDQTPIPIKTLPPTWTPEPTIESPQITPLPSATPVKTPALPDVLPDIAYLKNNQLWFWEAGSPPKSLLPDQKISDLRMSEDGNKVIYRLSSLGELWVVSSDGTNHQSLLTRSDMVGLAVREEALYAMPLLFGFLPGTDQLAITTYDYIGTGSNLNLNEDLHLIDIISGELKTILGPWQGGIYSFSPDGSLISLDTKGVISLMDPRGKGLREIFRYSEIPTEGHRYWYYYPNIVWVPEQKAFMVIIPPNNIYADTPLPSVIWRVPLDGSGPTRVYEFKTSVPAYQSRPRLDPTCTRVAYQIAVGNDTSLPRAVKLDNIDGSGSEIYGNGEIKLFSWSPDGQYFVYSEDDQSYLVRFGEKAQSLDKVLNHLFIESVETVTWIDNSTYLLQLETDQGHLLWIRSVDGRGLQVDLSDKKITDVESALP